MAQITCKDLSFAYDGHTVLSGINFSIDAGSYLCIVGENGSGKSTLMKGLLGLKKPASGSITLGDGLKQTEIGYLPQQTQLQRDFPASVYEVVLSGRLNSMGGRMFYNAELLLLDEPVTGLDPVATNEMYNLIKLINLCDGTSVIMISHDIHEAVRYATHILHLGNRQLFFGTTAQYRESDLARRFVGGGRA